MDAGHQRQQDLTEKFEEAEAHFESAYHLTLVWMPPAESSARAGQWLLETSAAHGIDWREQLQRFVTETDRFLSLLEGVMPEIGWCDDEATSLTR